MSLHAQPRFTVYQFYVRLRDFRPTVWRRLQIDDCELGNLLWTVAQAFGLDVEDLPSKLRRALTDYRLCGHHGQRLRADAPLRKIVPLDGTELTLRLDVGKVNVWRFELIFEGMHLSAIGTKYPICLEGGRANIPRGVKPCELDLLLYAEGLQRRHPYTWTPDTPQHDLATFDLVAVNRRLGHFPARNDARRESYYVLRVELNEAEQQIALDHGNVDDDERREILAHATPDALGVYVPEALALARNLARAANRAPAGPLQHYLERLSGRFQRHAYAWIQQDREIARSVAEVFAPLRRRQVAAVNESTNHQDTEAQR